MLDIFGSLDDPRIAHLGFLLSVLDEIDLTPGSGLSSVCNPENKYARCAIQALIPCNMIQTIQNLTGGSLNGAAIRVALQGASPTLRKQIIEGIVGFGGRSLAFVYVMYVVFDFSKCIATSSNTENGSLVLLEAQSNLLPNPDPSYNFYVTTEQEAINYGTSPAPSTPVYYNSLDNKYYIDYIFSTLVPDGYYVSAPIASPNFHHIVNGVAIAVYGVQ